MYLRASANYIPCAQGLQIIVNTLLAIFQRLCKVLVLNLIRIDQGQVLTKIHVHLNIMFQSLTSLCSNNNGRVYNLL